MVTGWNYLMEKNSRRGEDEARGGVGGYDQCHPAVSTRRETLENDVGGPTLRKRLSRRGHIKELGV